MSRVRYHVTPHPEGWQVIREGASRASSVAPTQEEAIADARQFVEGWEEAEVSIHGRDGRIREGWTYGGEDPFPPRG